MKKITIVFILIFLQHWAKAQEQGNFRVLLSGQHTQFSDRFIRDFGFGAEYYVSDEWSIGYHFSFGANTDREFFAHIPTGTWFASYPFRIFANFGDDFWLYATVLSVLLPESINFHIRPSDSFHISPFIAPLGMYYEETQENPNPNFKIGLSTGVRLNIFKDNFSIAPYGGVRGLYEDMSKLGVFGGLNLSVSF